MRGEEYGVEREKEEYEMTGMEMAGGMGRPAKVTRLRR